MLQLQPACDQARWQCGPVSTRGEEHREGALNLGPVDQAGQAHQRMLEVEQFIQAVNEQGLGAGRKRLGTY